MKDYTQTTKFMVKLLLFFLGFLIFQYIDGFTECNNAFMDGFKFASSGLIDKS